MSKATLSQGQQLLNLVSQSGIARDQLQALLESGRLSVLLQDFMEDQSELAHPKPTITPIEFDCHYGQTLVKARDAMELEGYVEQNVNDINFKRNCPAPNQEFVLVCFHRDIYDDEDPDKSELLRELDKLGLKPASPMELCFVGRDERTRDLQREFPIVARSQVWRDPHGHLHCPFLHEDYDGRYLSLRHVQYWLSNCRFLASRK